MMQSTMRIHPVLGSTTEESTSLVLVHAMKQSRPSLTNRRKRLSTMRSLVICTALLILVSLYSSLQSSSSVHLDLDYQSDVASITAKASSSAKIYNEILVEAPINIPIITDNNNNNNNNNTNSSNDLLQGLPDWIQTYIHWHQEQRSRFPGNQLFTNPDAPKLLIRTCYRLYGRGICIWPIKRAAYF
jgi:hypothetical protein